MDRTTAKWGNRLIPPTADYAKPGSKNPPNPEVIGIFAAENNSIMKNK
jgi:hypothetical protein